MLEQLRSLATQGSWSEVLHMAQVALASARGDDAAHVNLLVASAYASTAQSPADWNKAISHTEAALCLSTPGSVLHTWALQKMSSLCVDTGRTRRVMGYAQAYLRAAPNHPVLSALTPYVVRDISHVYYRQGKFSLSATWRVRALRLFEETGSTNEVIRTRLNIAWAYARAGDTIKATAFLPSTVPDDMTHLVNGAKAVIAFGQRRWHDAKSYGLLALQGARLAHDFVDAAEVSLIVSKSVAELGSSSDARDYIRLAALLANRQDTNADALMVLNLRSEGGEAPNEATVFCGSGGFHPDACFTPGVG